MSRPRLHCALYTRKSRDRAHHLRSLCRSRLRARAAAMAWGPGHPFEAARDAGGSTVRRPAVQPRRALSPAAEQDLSRDDRPQGEGASGPAPRHRRYRSLRGRPSTPRREHSPSRIESGAKVECPSGRAPLRRGWSADVADLLLWEGWQALSLLRLGTASARCKARSIRHSHPADRCATARSRPRDRAASRDPGMSGRSHHACCPRRAPRSVAALLAADRPDRRDAPAPRAPRTDRAGSGGCGPCQAASAPCPSSRPDLGSHGPRCGKQARPCSGQGAPLRTRYGALR